jgi:hypothetical protein
MSLAFIIDNKTSTALALFERTEIAEQERGRLGDHERFAVELYRPGGDELSTLRINQIGGRLAAYTFG